MNGKIVMVTGATSGIGKATALALAKLGATVIIVARNEKKAQTTINQIKAATGSDHLNYLLCDLTSLNSIRQCVADFKSRYSQLHVLINNAGVQMWKRVLTVDGFESTFAVNYLATFLLTMSLLNTLKISAPSRIVNVSSAGHKSGHIHFEDLMAEKKFSSAATYGQSKLAVNLFTFSLAKKLEGTGVTVNCLHPGSVRTNIARNLPITLQIVARIFSIFLVSPEKGAETSVYLASSPDVENVTGKYFADKKESQSSQESLDESIAQRLWDVTIALTGAE